MRLSRAIKISLLAAAVALYSLAGLAKDSGDYWRHTGLKFENFGKHISAKNCYKDEQRFRACLQALNRVLNYASPKLELVASSRFDGSANFGPVVKEFKGLKAVELTDRISRPNQSRLEYWTARRLEREADAKASAALFSEMTELRVPFKAILNWAQELSVIAQPQHEALITADALNVYLQFAVDPHTRIVPKQFLHDLIGGAHREGGGVGLKLTRYNKAITVQEVLANSPAEKIGIRPYDVVTRVNEMAVTGESARAVEDRLAGDVGSFVKISIMRGERPMVFHLTREKIVEPNVSAQVIADRGRTFLHLKVSSFSDILACERARKAVRLFQEEAKGQGIILDLRGNAGGLVDEATCLTNIFVPKGTRITRVASIESKAEREELATEDQLTKLPLVVLIDARSASASELAAAALQDHDRALIVGERSFGKHTTQSQSQYELNPKILILTTDSTYHRPALWKERQSGGVTPDVEAFENPDPTEEEKFAPREEDYYPEAFASTAGIRVVKKPTIAIQSTQACMTRTGLAEVKLEKLSDALIAPDYQLLVAQDALFCMVPTWFEPALPQNKKGRRGE